MDEFVFLAGHPLGSRPFRAPPRPGDFFPGTAGSHGPASTRQVYKMRVILEARPHHDLGTGWDAPWAFSKP